MNVKMRQEIERKIASAFIRSAIAAGYSIRVHDGEDWATKPSTNRAEILKAMFSVDEEHLFVYKKGEEDKGWIGWVFFVYGNDGYDVICDYTVNLEPLMALANKVSDRYA